MIFTSQTLYIYDENAGGMDEETVVITINQLITVDEIANISACESTVLPAITGTGLSASTSYNTNPLGTGTVYVPGDIITQSITLYVFDPNADPNCFSTWPFANHPRGTYYEQNQHLPLWQIIRASVAAPTYFLPLVLDIGEGLKGAFIDGGISMDNNPSLRLFLMATLQGYPFRWPKGEKNLLLLSIGTGLKHHPSDYKKFMDTNLLDWAGQLPEFFLHDASFHNQMIMQLLSNSSHAVEIDSEIGRLEQDTWSTEPALHYIRYNVPLNPEYLMSLKLPYSEKIIRQAGLIDKADNLDLLTRIGSISAEQLLHDEHFPPHFDPPVAPK